MEMSLINAGLAAGAALAALPGHSAPVHAADAQARHLSGAQAGARAAAPVEEADADQELAACSWRGWRSWP